MTNAQILSAVIARFARPAISQFTSAKINALPFMENVEAKLKSTGWVSNSWSLSKELEPFFGGISERTIIPIIEPYISKLPDETIPEMIHELVDNAMKQGSLELFEGNILFEMEDLRELKKLLDCNLPLKESEYYCVKTE